MLKNIPIKQLIVPFDHFYTTQVCKNWETSVISMENEGTILTFSNPNPLHDNARICL